MNALVHSRIAFRIVAIAAMVLLGAGNALASCQVPEGRDAIQADVVDRVNAYRKANRRTMLDISDALTQAAQNHACYMAAAGQMSHRGANGSGPADRVSAVGYRWRFVAENVAAGQRSGPEAFASWQGSSGHRANMLRRNAREIGIGLAIGNGTYYWVMVLAAPG